jgi:hypothetical protein
MGGHTFHIPGFRNRDQVRPEKTVWYGIGIQEIPNPVCALPKRSRVLPRFEREVELRIRSQQVRSSFVARRIPRVISPAV